MKIILFVFAFVFIYSCKRTINNDCNLIVDSNYIRKNLSHLNKFHNPKIDTLIDIYEKMPLQNVEDDLNAYNNYGNLYSLSIPELKHSQWQFLFKKTINEDDSLFTLNMYLLTKNDATINDIFQIGYISNDQMIYKLTTCFSDSIIKITRVIEGGSDLRINGTSIYDHDSLIRIYSLRNENLLLREERNFKKYTYYIYE